MKGEDIVKLYVPALIAGIPLIISKLYELMNSADSIYYNSKINGIYIVVITYIMIAFDFVLHYVYFGEKGS
jgi:hypothetical protein